MKKHLLLLLFPALLLTACENVDLPDELPEGLSEEDAANGLKEALRVGTDSSIVLSHKTDGYFGTPKIKIPFPPEAINMANKVIAVVPGGQLLVDEVVLKLNRAAEDAADEAGPIFFNAITNMSIADALGILKGHDSSATMYLETNTRTNLYTSFKPDIQNSLESVGANQAWAFLTQKYNAIPLVTPVNTDLADYTTNKGLDGLFVLITEREGKIRNDVTARVTDILKKVFAEQD